MGQNSAITVNDDTAGEEEAELSVRHLQGRTALGTFQQNWHFKWTLMLKDSVQDAAKQDNTPVKDMPERHVVAGREEDIQHKELGLGCFAFPANLPQTSHEKHQSHSGSK